MYGYKDISKWNFKKTKLKSINLYSSNKVKNAISH